MLKRTLNLLGSLLLFVPLAAFSAGEIAAVSTLMPVPAQTATPAATEVASTPQVDALSARIGTLQQENATLRTALTKEQAAVSSLSRMIQTQAQQPPIQNTLLGYVQSLRARLGEMLFNLAVGSVIFALLIFAVLLWPRQQLKPQPEPPKEAPKTNEDDEYDYLGSEEGIPAKLDLARAYTDMDDNDSAKSVLKEIIDQGNDEQRHEASVMLEAVME